MQQDIDKRQLWGNPAHVQAHIQKALQLARRLRAAAQFDWRRQAAFELGLLIYELCTGGLHVDGYPETLDYKDDDLRPFPAECSEFAGLAKQLVRIQVFA